MGSITAHIQHKKNYSDGSTLYDMQFQDEDHFPSPILVRMTAFGGDLVLVERVRPVPETVKTAAIGKELP